ncbi:hypothetical protein BJY01DRAFT_256318 [Aspergillus pseudoustus]|uniref:NACHT domain-containing protein n=1 Tax=Aspergillus pseudoustus TaxID=1810923 RepID=A0ABR4IBZ0_9EURO
MPPSSRDEFEIAIICALTLEADAVEALFDDTYDRLGQRYRKQHGDTNAYINGKIGHHDVVLCYLPGMGKRNAAAATANLRVSYPNIKLALLVGICGAVPFLSDKTEVILGDVIISDSVVEYDFGRQYLDGFRQKSDVKDTLGRPNAEIRSFLAALSSQRTRNELHERIRQHLAILQTQLGMGWEYPGIAHDVLFEPSFGHRHYKTETHHTCACFNSTSSEDRVCGEALAGDCGALGCSGTKVVRDRFAADVPDPRIHVGKFASADTVMKSGQHRDGISKQQNVVAFEMEGAGVWDTLPCIIIKGACDYADSHKNKNWQRYAAGTAACCTKALLEYWRTVPREKGPITSPVTSDISRHLSAYYTTPPRLLVQRVSGEPVPMHQCYINLAVVKSTRSGGGKPGNQPPPLSLYSRLNIEAVDEGDHLSLESLFEPRSGSDGKSMNPKRILIEGRAGVGKTTLCKRMVHDYLYQGMWHNLFDLVLWVPLRRLKGSSSQVRTLEQVFYNLFFSDVPDGKSLAESLQAMVFDSSEGQKLLFILDGMDEVSQEWDPGTPVHTLLLRLLNYPRVIVTSRPYGMHLTRGTFDLELEAIGFTTEQVEAYVKKIMSYDVQKASNILDFVQSHELILGLVRIPIQLDAVCYSWDQGFAEDAEPGTITVLYEKLTLKLWQKDVLRLRAPDAGRALNEHTIPSLGALQIRGLIPREIELIERIAFLGMNNGTIEFSSDHRHKIYNALISDRVLLPEVPEAVLRNVSFLHSDDPTLIDSDRSYHFIHLSFQEYFAARYFVRSWVQREKLLCLAIGKGSPLTYSITPQSFLQANKYNLRFDVMWRFAAGLFDGHAKMGANSEMLREYFDELEAEPRDLLGPAHQRLVMHSLAEVVSWKYQTGCYREQIEDRIFSWMNLDYGHDRAGRQWISTMDYPAHLLERFVDNEKSANKRRDAIRALLRQNIISTGFVSHLQALSTGNQSMGGTPYRAFDQELLAVAIFDALTLLAEDNFLLLYYVWHFWDNLAKFPLLSQRLVSCLQRGSNRVKEVLLHSLSGYRTLPDVVVCEFVPLLKEPSPIGWYAASRLRDQKSLSEQLVRELVALLGHNDPDTRSAAVEILVCQDPLPIGRLSEIFLHIDDECEKVQSKIVEMITIHHPTNSSAVLFCLAQGDVLVEKALDVMSRKGTRLPLPILEALCRFVHHESEQIRFLLTIILVMQPPLPPALAQAIVPLLCDNSPPIVFLTAFMMRQHSSLPAVCVQALQSSDTALLYYKTLDVDNPEPLSKQQFMAILPFLEYERLFPIMRILSQIFRQQLAFSTEMLDAIMELVLRRKGSTLWLEILHGQLPSQAIDSLLALLISSGTGHSMGRPSPIRVGPIVDILAAQESLPLGFSERILSVLDSPILVVLRSTDIPRLLAMLYRQDDLPATTFGTLFRLIGEKPDNDKSFEFEKFIRKHGQVNCNLAAGHWGNLYRLWLARSFVEQITCCLVDNCLVLDTPEGTLRVEFKKAQLRAFRHEIRKTQLELGIPSDTLLSESWSDRAMVRLASKHAWTRRPSQRKDEADAEEEDPLTWFLP